MKKLTITLDDDEYAHVKTQLKGYVRKLVQIDRIKKDMVAELNTLPHDSVHANQLRHRIIAL